MQNNQKLHPFSKRVKGLFFEVNYGNLKINPLNFQEGRSDGGKGE